MATLTVVKFPTANGADDALDTPHRLQNQELIRVHSAAVVTWPPDRKKPHMQELHDTKKSGALGGAFWGFLFGLIFLVPFFGAAIGARAGALMGSLRDVGISDSFIKEVREKITPRYLDAVRPDVGCSPRSGGRGISWLHRRNHPHQSVPRRGSRAA